MKFRDYSVWVFNEVKESKIFTVLNIFGVWINVFILVLFLSLALGVEENTVKSITKDTNVFTLRVNTSSGSFLTMDNFSEYQRDKRVLQISPVIGTHVTLKGSDNENTSVNEDIYIENRGSDHENDEDLRVNYSKLISGDRLSKKALDEIIISETLFKKIVTKNKKITEKNISSYPFEILAEEEKKHKTALFKCKIVGITNKAEENAGFVYATSSLAYKIDKWTHQNRNANIVSTSTSYGYEHFDLITKDIEDLGSLRKEVGKKTYETKSILDKIDGELEKLLAAKILVFFIIGISVLISAFNIMITLTSYVLKRRKDIGILKALGATNWQIQNIFIVHAIYLTFTGSILGVVTGVTFIKLIQFLLKKSDQIQSINIFKIDFNYILLIILVSNLVGIFSAIIPAHQAANITPIETMRSN